MQLKFKSKVDYDEFVTLLETGKPDDYELGARQVVHFPSKAALKRTRKALKELWESYAFIEPSEAKANRGLDHVLRVDIALDKLAMGANTATVKK